MKILHVVPTLSPQAYEYGGPSVAVIEMCKGLTRYGLKTEIATTHEGKNSSNDIPGVVINSFRHDPNKLLPSGLVFSPDFGKWVKDHTADFDIIDVHTVFNYPSTQTCLNARIRKVPYVLRPCGMLDPWCLRRSYFKKKIWMMCYKKNVLDTAAAIHFTSLGERTAAEALRIAAPSIVLPIGVNRIVGHEGGVQTSIDKRLQQFNGQKRILFLSRLRPKKGLDLLIPALGVLAKRRNDFVFILAGDGTAKYEKKIKEMIVHNKLDRRVIITGFIDEKEKSAALSLSDIFVLPSYQENFGIVVAEAMAAGLPVVISDQINICSDVRSYNAGLITRLDVGEIANAIEMLINDESMRRRMGENGKRLIQEKFNWEIIIPELIKLYEQIRAKHAA